MSVLIVHRDSYMTDELESLMRGIVDVDVDPARKFPDLATARAELAGATPPTVLVVESDLPDGGRHAGLTLALEMRARWTEGKAIPVLIVATASDAALSKAVGVLPACALICEGSSLERDFQYALRCLLAELEGHAAPVVQRPPRYNIHIRVDGDGNCVYEVRNVGTTLRCDSLVRFGVEPTRLLKLLERMPRMSDGEAPTLAERIDTYQEVGDELAQALFREQVDVVQEYGMLLGLMRASPQARVGLCFSVDRVFYRIPFEALRLPTRGDSPRYWMEDRPLWRSLPEYPLSRPMLFSLDAVDPTHRPVDCLLINAKCGGDVCLPGFDPGNPKSGVQSTLRLGAIANADDEVEEITNVLVAAIPQHVGRLVSIFMEKNGTVATRTWDRSGRPERIERHAGAFDDVLERLLTREGPWQLVHLTGHSHFIGNEDKGVGYIFVPKATTPGAMPAPKPVSIGKMASWLTEARFAFLSGCSSSHLDFVHELCARDVPALSGYPWPVLDDIAWKHSAHFYRRLLQSCSIEEALQKSWLDMYSEHHENWAWASSQFVIQGSA